MNKKQKMKKVATAGVMGLMATSSLIGTATVKVSASADCVGEVQVPVEFAIPTPRANIALITDLDGTGSRGNTWDAAKQAAAIAYDNPNVTSGMAEGYSGMYKYIKNGKVGTVGPENFLPGHNGDINPMFQGHTTDKNAIKNAILGMPMGDPVWSTTATPFSLRDTWSDFKNEVPDWKVKGITPIVNLSTDGWPNVNIDGNMIVTGSHPSDNQGVDMPGLLQQIVDVANQIKAEGGLVMITKVSDVSKLQTSKQFGAKYAEWAPIVEQKFSEAASPGGYLNASDNAGVTAFVNTVVDNTVKAVTANDKFEVTPADANTKVVNVTGDSLFKSDSGKVTADVKSAEEGSLHKAIVTLKAPRDFKGKLTANVNAVIGGKVTSQTLSADVDTTSRECLPDVHKNVTDQDELNNTTAVEKALEEKMSFQIPMNFGYTLESNVLSFEDILNPGYKTPTDAKIYEVESMEKSSDGKTQVGKLGKEMSTVKVDIKEIDDAATKDKNAVVSFEVTDRAIIDSLNHKQIAVVFDTNYKYDTTNPLIKDVLAQAVKDGLDNTATITNDKFQEKSETTNTKPPVVEPKNSKKVSDINEKDVDFATLQNKNEVHVWTNMYEFGTVQLDWKTVQLYDKLDSIEEIQSDTVSVHNAKGDKLVENNDYKLEVNNQTNEVKVNLLSKNGGFTYLFNEKYQVKIQARIKPTATDSELQNYIDNGGVPNENFLFIGTNEGEKKYKSNIVHIVPPKPTPEQKPTQVIEKVKEVYELLPKTGVEVAGVAVEPFIAGGTGIGAVVTALVRRLKNKK